MKSISESKARLDGEEKVTGRAVYTDDIRLPGMLHAKLLRSPYPHARLVGLNVSRAIRLPGVAAVLTRDDFAGLNPFYGFSVKDQPVVALDKVRYAGDVVAAVAAVDEDTAEEAASLIEVEYEQLPAVFTVKEALVEGAPLLHENIKQKHLPKYGRGCTGFFHEGTNICFHFRYERGDVEEAFESCDHVFEDIFTFPRAQHCSLEPHVSVAYFESGGLTVWTSTQSPFVVRQELSRIFQIRLNKVRVVVPCVGAGYGGKHSAKFEPLAAALSQKTGRPVKLSLSMEESFKTVTQHSATIKMKTGVKKDGTLVARQSEVLLNTGAYAEAGPLVIEKAGYRAHGPYRIPHVKSDAFAVYTNTVPAGPFRGFGGTQVAFAYESQMDMIAEKLGMDPLEIRLKNVLNKGEEFAPGDTPIDSDLKEALKLAAKEIGWHEKGRSPYRGKGISCALKDGGGINKPSNALVKITEDGSIVLSFGTVEVGQGINTAMAQIVANEMDMPFENILVAPLDTTSTPYDQGTLASAGIAVTGPAVQRAAQDVVRQILEIAGMVLGLDPATLRFGEGKVHYGENQSLPLRDVMIRHFGGTGGEIVGTGFFKVSRNNDAPLGYPCPFWEVGIGGADVVVDPETGEVKILKYISVTDAGKMIHPNHCRGQDEGAAMFGIGHTLFESMIFRDGQLMNPNLIEYRLPNFRDLPDHFESRILEGGSGPGPYGAKGLGEGGILPVASAVTNAVYNAVGVRIKEIPLYPERVLKSLSLKND